MSHSNSNSGSGAPSPEAQFHIPGMNRSDSPNTIDFNPNHNESDLMLRSSLHHQHIDDNHHQDSESFFSHGGVQSMYNTSNNFHLVSEYHSDSDNFALKQSLAGSKTPNDFGAGLFRSSLSAYNGVNTSNTGAAGSYRVRQSDGLSSQHFPNANDLLGSHQSLGLQQQLSQQSQQGVSRSGLDFGSSSPLGNGKASQIFSSLDPFLQAHSTKGHLQSQAHDAYHSLSHSNSGSQIPYLNGIQLQSQTPYGPHLQSNSGAAGVSASNARPMGSSGQINMTLETQTGNSGQPEEISTIFVVGFPDDMQEREFQNMFTFSPGFEAATLKIPNKEYTAYGSVGGASSTPSGLPLRGGAYSGYLGAGSNDPYNVVTVNQGGVVIDNGRDGPTASWPPLAMPLDEPSHFQVGQGIAGQPPRKQIIGFAKFRTRQEALEARDLLQGRRVDIEKGAILKAEMAKKNLHTKRGVGMVATTSASGSVSLSGGMANVGSLSGGMGSLNGLGNNTDLLANFAGLSVNSNLSLNNLSVLSGNNSDILSGRERERELSTAGLGGPGWREGKLGDSSEDERDRRREALGAMGLGLGLMRGARERAQADEEERVRRNKDLKQFQTDASRMMPGNTTAFEAFHSISPPTLSRHSQSGLLSPAGGSMSLSGLAEGGSNGPSPLMGNGYGNIIAQTGRDGTNNVAFDLNGHRESRSVGPWDPPSTREREGSSIPHALSSLYAARKSMVPGRPPSPQQESPPHSHTAFSPINDDDLMLPPHRSGALRSLYPLSSQADESLSLQTKSQSQSIPPNNNSSGSVGVLEIDRPVLLAVSTSAQPGTGSTGTGSPQLPSPASQSGSASSFTGGTNGGGSATSVGGTNVGAGPRNVVVDQNPPINTLYVGNLPTGSVGSGYPAGFLEESLRDLFARRPGFRKLCFRQKSNGPMCFVEFEDVHYATKALNELYGNTLGGIVKNGGIRLSYSKNPLGVRTPTSAGTSASSLQQQQGVHSGVVSPFPPESYQTRHPFDVDTSMGARRDSSATTSLAGAYGYSRSPPPPRFFSPPPPANFGMTPTASTGNATSFPRGSQAFGLPSPNGSSSNFSPFGLPLSSPRSRANGLPPSHISIPDQSSELSLAHDYPQHFPHRALSPSSTTLEAARAG